MKEEERISQIRPVTCLECAEAGKKFRQHVLIPHLVIKHKMTPLEYLDKHGAGKPVSEIYGEMLASELGWEKIKAYSSEVQVIPRRRVEVPFTKLFPQFSDAKTGTEYDGTYPVVKRPDHPPGSRRVEEDPRYFFPEKETVTILKILAKRRRNRIWIKGYSGTGKTELVRQLSVKTGLPLFEIQGNAALQRASLVGTWGATKEGTYFKYAKLPLWFKHGGILVVHEFDTLSPHTVNLFKSVLEDPPTLSIEETGETLEAHPDCKIIITTNTWGKGDDTGLFVANTHIQSAADRRRWSAKIKLDYLPAAEEQKLLANYFPPKDKSGEKMLEQVVDFANRVRDGFKNRVIDYTISPAELVNWVENTLYLDCSMHEAADLSFINDMEPDVATSVRTMLEAVFGPDPRNAP